MSMKINPPVFKKACNYERYKQELLAWREVTDLVKNKQGIAIALTLPENDETKIRERVFDELPLTDLKQDDGFEKLLAFLDKHLGKDDLEDSLSKFEDFEDYTRNDEEPINDYIVNFDQKYNRILKKDMKLPSEILAFKLLRKAKITKEEKLLVLTGMNYSQKDTLYEQAKKSLKKFKGEGSIGANCNNNTLGTQGIKLEPTFLAAHEDALLAAGYVNQRKWRWQNRRGTWDAKRGNSNVNMGSRSGQERPINPIGSVGQPITCRACGSYRQLVKNCPHSWEKLSKVNVVDLHSETEHVVLFTGYNKQDIAQLGVEAKNCAVLDSACTSTVCGKLWIQSYLDSLSDSDKNKVVSSEGRKIFKFGGGTKLKSIGEYHLPAVISGREVTIITDVVDSDIPLLLSRSAMKKAHVKLDIVNDTAEILGKQMALNITTSGHYCIPIDKEISLENIFSVKLSDMSNITLKKAITKLHRQFAHPPAKRLISLLKDAGVWQDEYNNILTEIQENCDVCKMYATTPPRPCVAMPMAKYFNQKVALDSKQWNERWILHCIDMWSRFTVSIFIDRKKTRNVVDKLMTEWIGIFGVMEAILTDNGGEFNSEEMREITSILNVEVHTTAAESPFQNGLCERVHAVTDIMLMKLKFDYKDISEDSLLRWANMARNSLQMWCGFSSYQLVFGINPKLPNLMCDSVPALEGSTSSEIFAEHLNILHAARRAYIQSECEERIRRALRCKVRASEQTFSNGDKVYYKREGKERWLGPGKVVFQDGKVIFVRHGGVFVRVSPNRLIKACCSNSYQSITDNCESSDKSSNRMIKQSSNGDNCTEVMNKFSENDNESSCAQDSISEIIGDNQPKDVTKPVHSETLNISLKENDEIRYKIYDSDDWTEASVLGRAGKSTGKHRTWYNVRDSSGESKSIDLGTVCWEKVPLEDVNVVLIPKIRQNDPECLEAKLEELNKLKTFDVYEEIENKGQFCVSTRWLLWHKGESVRARLVARGFEEMADIQTDSPTVGKCVVRVFSECCSQ